MSMADKHKDWAEYTDAEIIKLAVAYMISIDPANKGKKGPYIPKFGDLNWELGRIANRLDDMDMDGMT